jgi:hypothetical protein
MGVYIDTVGDVSLGTSTAKTQLSGDRSGNATSFTLNAKCRAILAVQPYFYVVTPTSTQTATASMKIESDDLALKDYEVFAPPVGDAVATNDTQTADLMRTCTYPLMQASQGGEAVNFYGIPQIANTAAPFMGAQVWWSDDPRTLTDLPFRAKIGGAAGGGASMTSTGTSATLVTGATITLAGQPLRTIRSVTGLLVASTAVSAKPQAGWFALTAGEIAYAIRYAAEPVQGMLGTGTQAGHLTRTDNLAIPVQPPTTIQGYLNVTAASTTAGNFAQGILYN